MSGWRKILFPFSVFYGAGVWLRNRAFDLGLKRSKRFSLPVICIGNLEVGGAGKTPMTEYLIRLLKNTGKISTLSRGYGRKSSGFLRVEKGSKVEEVGDEPAQLKAKFPEVSVVVDENRVNGIRQIEAESEVIILDDAFQHRAVSAGLNILLFDYASLQRPKLLLPAGNWRDVFSERKRADIMVVTKCPELILPEEKLELLQRLKTVAKQDVFFSTINYGEMKPLFTPPPAPPRKGGEPARKSELGTQNSELTTPYSHLTSVYLLTGIANPKPLADFITQKTARLYRYSYPDHHAFSTENIAKLVGQYEADTASDKIIVTTEKDGQRLQNPALKNLLQNLPVYVQPIETVFLDNDGPAFNRLIEDYVSRDKKHR